MIWATVDSTTTFEHKNATFHLVPIIMGAGIVISCLMKVARRGTSTKGCFRGFALQMQVFGQDGSFIFHTI
jgi:hypothetical protein